MGERVNIGRPAVEAVTAAEADPTLVTEGISVEGFGRLSVAFHTLTGVTSYDLQVWMWDGAVWARAADASNALIDIDGITTTWAQQFDVAGFSRAFVQVNAGVGFGSLRRQYAVARL